MWLWHVKMATQKLLKLLLLLKLMMRNVSTTVWCRFGRWTLVIKLSFCSDFEDKFSRFVQIWKVNFGHKVKFLFGLWGQGFKVCSRFWSWCSGKILKLKFGYYFAADAWFWLLSSLLVEILVWFCRNGDVWLRFWSWCKVEILKMFDQDLCLNLWYDPKKLLW